MWRNLTQEELAEAAQVDRRTISRFENGHAAPNLDHLHLIARHLAVPAAWLFTDDDLPPAP
jgi:transcriptional regulator with XRE-family HTH domain